MSWKQPDATHIVLYKKSETKLKELDGRVACKLTADNHGRSEWWLLLERVETWSCESPVHAPRPCGPDTGDVSIYSI